VRRSTRLWLFGNGCLLVAVLWFDLAIDTTDRILRLGNLLGAATAIGSGVVFLARATIAGVAEDRAREEEKQ
jgi:hypothetical protein